MTTVLSGIAEGDMVYANPGPGILSPPSLPAQSSVE